MELVKERSAVSPDPGPVEGFSFAESDRLIGEEADRVVTWNGKSDISSVGSTVAIRIRMFQAKLFAYKI